MIFGYSRVSTAKHQSDDLQRQAFKTAGVERIFSDVGSGGRWKNRDGLTDMLSYIREGDVVVVWKMDRLSRTVRDLLTILDKIQEAGAGFRSLTESIDTTTPAGKMVTHMIGVIAEYERGLLAERTKAGLEAARKRGRVGGRRPKLNAGQKQMIRETVASGTSSAADMARTFDVSDSTISRIINQK